jgi:hypothetical protein
VSGFPPEALRAGRMSKECIEKRTVEPQNVECRMSKECILPVVSLCVERSILLKRKQRMTEGKEEKTYDLEERLIDKDFIIDSHFHLL